LHWGNSDSGRLKREMSQMGIELYVGETQPGSITLFRVAKKGATFPIGRLKKKWQTHHETTRGKIQCVRQGGNLLSLGEARIKRRKLGSGFVPRGEGKQ